MSTFILYKAGQGKGQRSLNLRDLRSLIILYQKSNITPFSKGHKISYAQKKLYPLIFHVVINICRMFVFVTLRIGHQ